MDAFGPMFEMLKVALGVLVLVCVVAGIALGASVVGIGWACASEQASGHE